ncbi:MAG: hypothetical protein J6B96_01925 [Agathobacter sp.]|nr:hypothetical protein [Agathobacter sp.]
MFGNKKKILEEQNRNLLAQLSEKRESFETGVTELEETGKRIHTDLCQVMENSEHLVEHAMVNIEEESKLMFYIDDFAKDLKNAVDNYEALRILIEKQLEATTSLVEENKHVTTPAKYLQETPASMKAEAESYQKRLEEMEEDGRKMGVLALNAAIEAGRMGETSKQFVSAAEEIRQTALSFEKRAATMREELAEANGRIAELEEVIARLLSLTKESNMGVTRLLKKNQEISQAVVYSGMRDFSNDMIELRDKIVGLRNLDEEIAKCGERDKIQLSDVQEDVANQKKQLAELESDISYMLDMVEEQSL